MPSVRKTMLCLILAAAACGTVAARPVAVVNGEEISRDEFGSALVRSLGRSAVNSYVDRVLIRQEARRRGVQVADEELQRRREIEIELRMRRIFENARMSAEEFRRAAEGRGWDMEEVRGQIADGISEGALRSRLLAEKMIEPEVDLSEEALREYFRQTRGRRFAAAHVLLADRARARELLEVLRQRPELWPQAVQGMSQDRESVRYMGRMGPVPADSAVGLVLSGMEPGEMALYNEGELWHVLRLIAEIPPADVEFEQVKDRVRRELLAERAQSRLHGILAQLHERAEVVPNLSSDPAERRLLGRDAVAFVNGEAIEADAYTDALVREFGPTMLESYVERELIFQAARERGLTVGEEELRKRLRRIGDRLFAEQAADRGISPEEFARQVRGRGVALREFKQQLVREFVAPEDVRATLLAEKMVADGVSVTEQDLRRAYDRLGQERILVKELSADTRSAAQRLRGRIRQGASFDLLARTEAPGAGVWMEGGAVRTIAPDHPYYSEIKDLEPGDTSDVFQHEGRYRIIKVIRRRSGADRPSFESMREELRERVFLRKSRARIRALLVKLKAESEITVNLG
jgi:parvulin-like peptidyl-prolyl isomerase